MLIPPITKTYAAIIPDPIGYPIGCITMLSGIVGDKYIRLFHDQAFIGFSFEVNKFGYRFPIISNFPVNPQSEILFYFQTITVKKYLPKSLPLHGLYLHAVLMEPHELGIFQTEKLGSIRIANITFNYQQCSHYMNVKDGQQLIQIAANSIAALIPPT
jgi:hypothetical protein